MEIVFLAAISVMAIMLIVWGTKKESLGIIRCNRCHYVDAPRGAWKPFKGMTPVCKKCGSENWVTIK